LNPLGHSALPEVKVGVGSRLNGLGNLVTEVVVVDIFERVKF
jgi:hypothetical protein